MTLIKVISGGQTGVDRAALDAALELNRRWLVTLQSGEAAPPGVTLLLGGWCPRGRRAEDGYIPDRYPLVETNVQGYGVRTRLNVKESDGTLILTPVPLSGGTYRTAEIAQDLGKPCLVLDPKAGARAALEHSFQAWVQFNEIRVLNVAGPRESRCPGVYQMAYDLLVVLFGLVAVPR